MTYLDAKVSRNLAVCAMSLFAILCLLEITNMVVTGQRIASGQEMVLTMVDIPILERLLLRTSADTLRGIAVLHGFVAFAMMAAYGWLTLSFSRRPDILKAAVMAGVLAFAPVTTMAEEATRAIVDLHRGARAYDQAMSGGDGTVDSSNRNRFAGSLVVDMTLGWPSLQSNRQGLQWFDMEQETEGQPKGAGAFTDAIELVAGGSSIFQVAYDAILVGTALLLFGWTIRNRLAIRRRTALLEKV